MSIFSKMEDDLNYFKMEDNLNFSKWKTTSKPKLILGLAKLSKISFYLSNVHFLLSHDLQFLLVQINVVWKVVHVLHVATNKKYKGFQKVFRSFEGIKIIVFFIIQEQVAKF